MLQVERCFFAAHEAHEVDGKRREEDDGLHAAGGSRLGRHSRGAAKVVLRYVVHPKETGRVRTRLVKKILDRLNAEPERSLLPKDNLR